MPKASNFIKKETLAEDIWKEIELSQAICSITSKMEVSYTEKTVFFFG